MSIITIDFETYYSTDFTLSKMSTESYIRDPRFEVIGVSIRQNGTTQWYTGDDVYTALYAIDWSKHSLLAFNTAFDGAIMAWHYGLRPALYLDAMGIAKCCGAAFNGQSLSAVCEHLQVGAKGDYVAKAIGKRLKDFTAEELRLYGEYCSNDVDRTVDIYKKLKPKFPDSEVLVQDAMLRMFIEPVLMFNRDVLQDHYTKTVEEKKNNLRKVAEVLGLDYGVEDEAIKKNLMSNPKFAALLESIGVEPPKKISPTTGEETWAFAKTDPAFMELLEDENSIVATAVAARLGVKSTIEETRAASYLDMASRGPWPIRYNYWAAHSRFTCSDGNAQNLKRGGRLRDAVESPPGHTLVTADLRQIECRFTNYIAGQDDIVELFRANDRGEGLDVYCIAASKIYGRVITPENKNERMAGKVSELSLGYGASKKAYKRMLFTQAGLQITDAEADRTVQIYRNDTHPKVRKLWYAADDALEALCQGLKFTLGRHGILDGNHPEEGIGLPNGTFIRLPMLKKIMTGDGQRKFIYIHRKKPTEIYGAMVVALCMQGLARITMTDAMLRIKPKHQTRMQTHDELVFNVVDAEVEEAKQFIHAEMIRQVLWALDLPLACEVGSGKSYGECK